MWNKYTGCNKYNGRNMEEKELKHSLISKNKNNSVGCWFYFFENRVCITERCINYST